MKARILLWQGAGRLVRDRPWFAYEDRPRPLFLHIFGYGTEFFQYLFPLERPLNSLIPIGTPLWITPMTRMTS